MPSTSDTTIRAYRIQGVVQGVGFRPFVAKLAQQHHITGWVNNNSHGVALEIEGAHAVLDSFIYDLHTKLPPIARIDSCELLSESTGPSQFKKFIIKASDAGGKRSALITPDSYVCDDCLTELFAQDDRRWHYPFINCTNCGPRYSIIKDIPYDRPLTTMRDFTMCNRCLAEYQNVEDRRFHAQPNACWECGPQLQLIDANQNLAGDPKTAIEEAVRQLKTGKILAVKGIGGFHLMVDSANAAAVARLRERKKRKEKPLAIMVATITDARKVAQISNEEERLLASPKRPIVIVRQRADAALPEAIAPKNKNLGIMLAYTPIQHLLLRDNFLSLVCTSANVSDYPIVYENDKAIAELAGIADSFLIHNRDIVMGVDDSIVQTRTWLDSSETIIRRARSYVPEPILFAGSEGEPAAHILSVGAELKNTICIKKDNSYFLSQHLGDLKHEAALNTFTYAINHLEQLTDSKPSYIACDMHPNFVSTRYAQNSGLPVVQVQHHHAHMAACMADNNLNEPCIGVIFDGFGYGSDGTLWGGEFLAGDYREVTRAGHFDYIPLLGGDKAVKEPYRIAIALLYETFGDATKDLSLAIVTNRTDDELNVLLKMAERRIHAPLSCSVGRLFDGVSALLGIREFIEYEGQAAIELEQATYDNQDTPKPLAYAIREHEGVLRVDYRPIIRDIVSRMHAGRTTSDISADFHLTIAKIGSDMCRRISSKMGINKIILSGGVFQNQYLSRLLYDELIQSKLTPYVHRKVPTNDGGISFGQAVVCAHQLITKERKHD